MKRRTYRLPTLSNDVKANKEIMIKQVATHGLVLCRIVYRFGKCLDDCTWCMMRHIYNNMEAETILFVSVCSVCSFVTHRSHFTDLDHVIQKQQDVCSISSDPSPPFTTSNDEEFVCQTPSGEMLALIGTKKQLSIMIRALQSGGLVSAESTLIRLTWRMTMSRLWIIPPIWIWRQRPWLCCQMCWSLYPVVMLLRIVQGGGPRRGIEGVDWLVIRVRRRCCLSRWRLLIRMVRFFNWLDFVCCWYTEMHQKLSSPLYSIHVTTQPLFLSTKTHSIILGLAHPDSPTTMSNKVFGTYGDTTNMKDQFGARSHNDGR